MKIKSKKPEFHNKELDKIWAKSWKSEKIEISSIVFRMLALTFDDKEYYEEKIKRFKERLCKCEEFDYLCPSCDIYEDMFATGDEEDGGGDEN